MLGLHEDAVALLLCLHLATRDALTLAPVLARATFEVL